LTSDDIDLGPFKLKIGTSVNLTLFQLRAHMDRRTEGRTSKTHNAAYQGCHTRS